MKTTTEKITKNDIKFISKTTTNTTTPPTAISTAQNTSQPIVMSVEPITTSPFISSTVKTTTLSTINENRTETTTNSVINEVQNDTKISENIAILSGISHSYLDTNTTATNSTIISLEKENSTISSTFKNESMEMRKNSTGLGIKEISKSFIFIL